MNCLVACSLISLCLTFNWSYSALTTTQRCSEDRYKWFLRSYEKKVLCSKRLSLVLSLLGLENLMAFKEFLSVLFLLDQPPGTPLRTRNLTSYQFFCPHTFDIFIYSFLAPPEHECIFMYVHKGTHTSVLLWKIFESFISLLTLIFPFSMFFCDVCDLAKNLQRTPRRLLPSLVHH